ncbi:MAG: hypothetical protein INR69_12650 [Mucilaginibacter polytrichastri]|nr:hypothetical protein [Mucilaginibacter polytrichastri]
MDLTALFQDKTLKAKARATVIAEGLLNGGLAPDGLIAYAAEHKATDKATCIEALEYATRKQPTIATEAVFSRITETLTDPEPRVKWESAKVIGNTAGQFPGLLGPAITNLLLNAEGSGTVVRWATAGALAEILKLKTQHNPALLPKITAHCEKEDNKGVKKKYMEGLKRAGK